MSQHAALGIVADEVRMGLLDFEIVHRFRLRFKLHAENLDDLPIVIYHPRADRHVLRMFEAMIENVKPVADGSSDKEFTIGFDDTQIQLDDVLHPVFVRLQNSARLFRPKWIVFVKSPGLLRKKLMVTWSPH